MCFAIRLCVCILSVFVLAGCSQHDDPEVESDEVRFRASRFRRSPHEFISADEPRMVIAREAMHLSADSEVLGFVLAGQSKAYGIQALAYHHVVNDRIGDTRIAVTY